MLTDLRTAAEAAAILLERREEDGLVQLLNDDPGPFIHQTHLWESKKSEAWIFGGNRSGKTEALAGCGASFLRFGNPNPKPSFAAGGSIVMYDRAVRLWAISLTYDMSRNIFQPRLFNNGAGIGGRHPMIPDSEILSWNQTNQTLRMKNGSVGLMKSCDGGRDTFMGADIDIALFDEVPDEEVYKEVTMRVGGGRRLLIRGAATILPPPNVPGGVSWMFPSKVAPWLDLGQSNAERNANSPNLDIITASIYDNPTILPEELRRMEAQYPPGSEEYLIRMKGELRPTIGGALVYGSAFRRTYHVVHTLAPNVEGRPQPQVHPYLPLALAVDFNAANGVWLVGQHVNGVFRVLDEIYLEKSDTPSMCAEFRNRYPAHAAELWVYGDATGIREEAQTGKSNFHLIAEYLQGYPVPIRFELPQANPPVKDRVAAVTLQLRSPDGVRRVEVAPHCTHLVEDLELTKWKPNGKIDKRGVFQSNGADCLGYWIARVCPTIRFGARTGNLRSVRAPSYLSGGQPALKSIRPVRIGNRIYARRIGA